MRTVLRLTAILAVLMAGTATLAQQGEPDVRGRARSRPDDLPPLRREMPPEPDRRSPWTARQQRPPNEPQQRPPTELRDDGRDPVVNVVEKGPREGDSVGTAFAVDADGNWVTAQHVVEDCRMIYVHVRGDWLPVTVLARHDVADVAVVRTRQGGSPMQVAVAQPLRIDQDGFQIGYPQFKPGATHVKLLGRVRVSRPKRGAAMEIAYSWAEISRKPNFEGTLGGISGGPIVDNRGMVVGVNILESSRRGRVTTSSSDSVQQVLGQARVAPRGTATTDITPVNYDIRADAAREGSGVARVFCAFSRDSVPPRARRN